MFWIAHSECISLFEEFYRVCDVTREPHLSELRVGIPMSAHSAVERCQSVTTVHMFYDITSSYARFFCMSGHIW